MWKCKKCGEKIEDSFDKCWQCGTADDPSTPRLPNKPEANAIQRLFADDEDATQDSSVSASALSQPKGVVLSHWYALIPGFSTSTKEFYAAVANELKERQVPGLDITRVEFSEGGLLSGKRQYLRMARERLGFDICAAPFGKAYFFSCRFVEIPSIVKLWQLAFWAVVFLVMAFVSWRYAGLWLGVLILIAVCTLIFFLLHSVARTGLSSVDSFLVRDPIIGSIYEKFFHKETYYREDTRLMYLDTVNAVVKELVEEITGAKGIKLIQFKDHSPILGELYKPTAVSLPKQTA
jgi:hypothetical protein